MEQECVKEIAESLGEYTQFGAKAIRILARTTSTFM